MRAPLLATISFALLMAACGRPEKNDLKKVGAFPVFDEHAVAITKPGFAGIFFVDPIPVLSIYDSASVGHLSERVAKCYIELDVEMKRMGAEASGSLGQMMYNNDTSNFRFECFCPLKALPKVKPKRGKIVMMDEGDMIVYNHYGPYQNLHVAYDSIKKILLDKNIAAAGAMREFYITDPTKENDTEKWLTRVMLPIKVKE